MNFFKNLLILLSLCLYHICTYSPIPNGLIHMRWILSRLFKIVFEKNGLINYVAFLKTNGLTLILLLQVPPEKYFSKESITMEPCLVPPTTIFCYEFLTTNASITRDYLCSWAPDREKGI